MLEQITLCDREACSRILDAIERECPIFSPFTSGYFASIAEDVTNLLGRGGRRFSSDRDAEHAA